MKTYEDLFVIGTSFLIQRGPNDWMRYHVRGIVDDGWIVVRYWSTVKRHWIYKVEPRVYFRMFYRDGLIKF